MARSGEKLPDVLPAELRPPAFRRASTAGAALIASPGSVTGEINLMGSLGSIATSPPPLDEDGKVMSPVSFEDKRKENFDKGISMIRIILI